MNKEYLYLSDRELLVIDENGHATKRNVESVNMHDMLLLENDLEKINKAITELEEKIHKDEEIKLTKKEKIIAAMIPFILTMSAYGVTCLIKPSTPLDIIQTTVEFALGTAILDIAFVVIVIKPYSKNINGIKSELSTAYQLSEELEQRLSNIKEKFKGSLTPNIVDLKKINSKINDVVILEESTQFCEKAKKQLHESYITGYEQKVKRLTLKK